MHKLSRVPMETDRIKAGEWSFEVVDMDSTRVDKVLATRHTSASSAV
jgi:CBS domain containing-hemolysin-like protein